MGIGPVPRIWRYSANSDLGNSAKPICTKKISHRRRGADRIHLITSSRRAAACPFRPERSISLPLTHSKNGINHRLTRPYSSQAARRIKNPSPAPAQLSFSTTRTKSASHHRIYNVHRRTTRSPLDIVMIGASEATVCAYAIKSRPSMPSISTARRTRL